MIKNIYLENYSTFRSKITLDLEADNRTKKFPDNVSSNNILKSAVIYGPNNSGKTQFMRAINSIKQTLLNKECIFLPNIFNKSNISKLGLTFVSNDKTYQYEFWRTLTKETVYEKFSEYKNNKENIIILKDTINKIYNCKSEPILEEVMKNTSNDNIMIYTLNVDKFKTLKKMKVILTNLANKIEVIDMNKISDSKTIDALKNKNNMNSKIVSFIKNADLFLDNYYYDESANHFGEINIKNQHNLDRTKMISVYKGKKVPSILFDSLGTNKMASLASYIIEALEEGKYLFIDELDSSLHFKLTRAIISMFNSDLNTLAQIVCTIHDISLLDCNKLFRKEQICFIDKDQNDSYLFSLKEFSYEKTGIRDTTDLLDKYKKGLLGAIPKPDLIATLLDDND